MNSLVFQELLALQQEAAAQQLRFEEDEDMRSCSNEFFTFVMWFHKALL